MSYIITSAHQSSVQVCNGAYARSCHKRMQIKSMYMLFGLVIDLSHSSLQLTRRNFYHRLTAVVLTKTITYSDVSLNFSLVKIWSYFYAISQTNSHLFYISTNMWNFAINNIFSIQICIDSWKNIRKKRKLFNINLLSKFEENCPIPCPVELFSKMT